MQLVSAASPDILEQVKGEMHQSIVETGTSICDSVGDLRIEMHRTRGELVAAAERAGLQVAAAGTHPFSSWIDQVISPGERYQNIVEELQQLARSLLIFGMHVHVAMPDKQTTIDMMNMVRYFLPHLLALSTSSPFWMGRNTGLKSFRTTVFRRFPRTGVPEQFESWSAYENFINLLVETQLHRQRQENLVGRPPASHVRHAGIPHVRCAHQGRRSRQPSPRSPRPSSSSSIACTPAT